MPTYEYQCTSCTHKFEEFHGINENPIETCPVCEKKSVERLISGGTGLIFKGQGFYITDYKGNKGKNENGKKPAESKPEKKEKPDTKNEK